MNGQLQQWFMERQNSLRVYGYVMQADHTFQVPVSSLQKHFYLQWKMNMRYYLWCNTMIVGLNKITFPWDTLVYSRATHEKYVNWRICYLNHVDPSISCVTISVTYLWNIVCTCLVTFQLHHLHTCVSYITSSTPAPHYITSPAPAYMCQLHHSVPPVPAYMFQLRHILLHPHTRWANYTSSSSIRIHVPDSSDIHMSLVCSLLQLLHPRIVHCVYTCMGNGRDMTSRHIKLFPLSNLPI